MASWKFLRSPGWVWAAISIVVFAVVCHLLAQWQLARRAEAQAEMQRISANFDAEPRPIGEVLPTLQSFSIDQKWLPVALQGEYLVDEEVLVRNRPCNGASGYDVLTPFRLDTGEVFVVDRGCVSPGSAPNTPDSFAAAPRGEQTVIARLRATEPIVEGRIDVGDTVGSINLTSLADRIGKPTFVGAYGQLVGGSSDVAPYGAERPVPDEGPHLSYALQWYVFTVIAVVVFIWAARQEHRRRLEDAGDQGSDQGGGSELPLMPSEPTASISVDAELSARYGVTGAGGRKPKEMQSRSNSKTRSQQSDAEVEDALLDR